MVDFDKIKQKKTQVKSKCGFKGSLSAVFIDRKTGKKRNVKIFGRGKLGKFVELWRRILRWIKS